MEHNTIFDSTIELPNEQTQQRAASLIGFEERFQQVYFNLRLLLDPDGLRRWSQQHHKVELPLLTSLVDRHPLIILEGDAGTGKTAAAEVMADRMARELNKTAYFLKLSTRVRGNGTHGQMALLVNQAFEELKKQAGKSRLAFLFIDEADAIATTRATAQMHQEEKAAVNTLIQKLDDTRELHGRAIVFLATNRRYLLDEAIVRRAAVIMHFGRPTSAERTALLRQELAGLKLSDKQVTELTELTGPRDGQPVGYSFSDMRLRWLPAAVARAFPEAPLTFDLLKDTVHQVLPTTPIE